MTKISIVTVAFNSEKTIGKAIESVLMQTYTAYEYILIDGASSDNTVSIVNSYSQEFEKRGIRYQLVSEPDSGIYDAMNKGIALTTGDVVGMINSDDWYEPIALQTVDEAYEKDNFKLFYADLNIIKASGNFVKRSKMDVFPSTRHWNHPTTFVAREIYDCFQYENRTMYDDWDLILRLKEAGCKTVIVNKVLANFSFGGCSSKREIRKAIERCKIRYNIYRKNGYSCLSIIECVVMETAKYLAS